MVEGTAPTPDAFATRVRNYEIVGRYAANVELDRSIAGVSQRQRHAYRLPVSRLGWSLKRVTDGGKERLVRGFAPVETAQPHPISITTASRGTPTVAMAASIRVIIYTLSPPDGRGQHVQRMTACNAQ